MIMNKQCEKKNPNITLMETLEAGEYKKKIKKLKKSFPLDCRKDKRTYMNY